MQFKKREVKGEREGERERDRERERETHTHTQREREGQTMRERGSFRGYIGLRRRERERGRERERVRKRLVGRASLSHTDCTASTSRYPFRERSPSDRTAN